MGRKFNIYKWGIYSVGFSIWYARYLRTYTDDATYLFWLGFLPNFGCALFTPLLALTMIKTNSLEQANRNILVGCLGTFIVLVLNEIADYYDENRVADWLDIVASGVGCLFIFVFYHVFLKKHIIF